MYVQIQKTVVIISFHCIFSGTVIFYKLILKLFSHDIHADYLV